MGTLRKSGPSDLSSVWWVGTGIVALVSFIAFCLSSASIPSHLERWEYWGRLIASYRGEPTLRSLQLALDGPMASPGWALVALVSTVGIGVLVTHHMRGHPAAAAMGWTIALVAAVLPPQLLAVAFPPDGAGRLTNPAIALMHLLLALMTAAWVLRPQAYPSETTSGIAATEDPGPPRSWNVRILLGVVAVYGVVVATFGLSDIHGFDSYSDHLGRPVRWLVTQRIERGLPDQAVPYYPGNFELLVRWTTALGTDRLGFTMSLASSLAALWVVFRIAREVGVSREGATVASLAAVSMQVLAYQSVVVYADLFMALALLLATWLLIVWARDNARDWRLAFGIGAALGVALGTKYSAGPPVVVLGLVFLWQVWISPPGAASEAIDLPAGAQRWPMLWQGGALALGVLPGMAYWYGRNLIEQGNPLFPLSVAGLPGIPLRSLLAGALGPQTWSGRAVYPWLETGYGAGFEMGLGPLVAAVMLPAVFIAPFLPKPAHARQTLLWVILVGSTAAWLQSGVLTPRFGLYPLLLGFVFVGVVWEVVGGWLLRAVVNAGLLLTVLMVGSELFLGILYTEVAWPMRPAIRQVVDALPPARIFNLAGEPAGFLAKGSDYRHEVEGLFRNTTPDDIRRLAPTYLQLPENREGDFIQQLPLELVARYQGAAAQPLSLWRYLGADSLQTR
jgi:hypothetical protein